ncbi:MAG: class I mannose-6-phosphate isomerase [Candidatus Fermentibacteria bacterium]
MLYISEPRYVPRVWGSLAVPGLEDPVGEIWWLCHEEFTSSLLRKAEGGEPTSVDDLVASDKLPGESVYPVLLKTLHTADKLSVQVHPGIGDSTLRKEETWLVLAAESGAWMMGGLKDNDRELFLDLLRTGRVEEVLRRIDLTAGDIYHIPPGTVHSLGPGLQILEVQSNCNVTYRLYDWGRTGIDGRPRELHIEKSMEAVDWSRGGSPVPIGMDGKIDRLKLKAGYRISDFEGKSNMDIPGGALFFVSSGSVAIQGHTVNSPACIIADMDGGQLQLSGAGYLIEPGGN